MADTEEDLGAVVRHVIPGRGSYPSYKFVFMHITRTVQPDSLLPVYADLFGEPWPEGDYPEDFDVAAAIAWLKSCHIHDLYKDWRDKEGTTYGELLSHIEAALPNSGWAPGTYDLAQGRVF